MLNFRLLACATLVTVLVAFIGLNFLSVKAGQFIGWRDREVRYGFIDLRGHWAIAPRYAYTHQFEDGVACVTCRAEKGHDGGFQLIDRNGRELLPTHMDRVGEYDDGRLMVFVHGQNYLIDRAGKIIAHYEEYDQQFRTELPLLRKDNIWGFKNRGGKTIWLPKVTILGAFCEGLAPASDGTLYGYIDENGKWAIKPQFAYAQEFSEGLARFSLKSPRQEYGYQCGFIDRSGKRVIKARFYEAGPFKDGRALARISSESRYGYIDKTGRWALAPKYTNACGFSNGIARVYDQLECEYIAIDKNGKDTGKGFPDPYSAKKSKLSAVRKKGRYGFYDESGNQVIKPQFEYASSFQDGLGAVQIDGKWGFIDQTGKIVIAPKYSTVSSFSDGLAAFQEPSMMFSGRWGFMDKTGRVVVRPRYDSVGAFSEGIAACTLKDTAGYQKDTVLIDKTGKELVHLGRQVFDVGRFSGGLAVAGLKDLNSRVCHRRLPPP